MLAWAVAAMLGVAIGTSILGVAQTWISTRVGQQIMHTLRTRVFAHLQRQSLGFFTRTRGGEVQSRLTNDIGGMQAVVTSTATSIAANVTTVVGTAIAMVALSWRLSLLTLVVLPPAVWLTRRVARMRRQITSRQQARMADLQTQIEEGLSVSGVLLGKTLGSGPALSARFGETSSDLVDLEVKAQLAGRWRMATMSVMFAALPAVLYLAAGLPVTSGGMTIGTLVAFVALQSALFRPLMGLLNVGVVDRQLDGTVQPDLRVPRPGRRDRRSRRIRWISIPLQAQGRVTLLRRQLPLPGRRPGCAVRHRRRRPGRNVAGTGR